MSYSLLAFDAACLLFLLYCTAVGFMATANRIAAKSSPVFRKVCQFLSRFFVRSSPERNTNAHPQTR